MSESLPDLEPPMSARELDIEIEALCDLASEECAKREGNFVGRVSDTRYKASCLA
jgi:hypothetical protein